MDSVMSFYEISAQTLIALLLALSALIALAKNADAGAVIGAARRLCYLSILAVTAGLIVALVTLASPNSAGYATFATVCFALGSGLSAVILSMMARLNGPDESTARDVIAVVISVIPVVAMILIVSQLTPPSVD